MKQLCRVLPRHLLLKLFSGIAAILVLVPIGLSTSSYVKTVDAAPNVAWLHTEGNQIVDEAGNQVILHGVNIENWNWNYAKNASISYESKAIPKATGSPTSDGWGANVILLAISSGPVNRNDETYLGLLDKMVAMAKANGAHTLVVYRSSEPDGEQPTMPDQAAETAMAKLAKRYANEPSVLYGLQVEPHDVSWSTLKPRLTSMVDAIRANNPKSLIAIPGTDWGRYVNWALTDPINRSNLVYKIHYYDPFSVVDTTYKLDSVAAKYPVIIGEFGVGSQSTLTDVVKLLDYSDARNISWIGWIFQKAGCPCMLTDTNTFATTPFGAEVKRRSQAEAMASNISAPVSVSVTTPAVAPVQAQVTAPAPVVKVPEAPSQPVQTAPQQPVNQVQTTIAKPAEEIPAPVSSTTVQQSYDFGSAEQNDQPYSAPRAQATTPVVPSTTDNGAAVITNAVTAEKEIPAVQPQNQQQLSVIQPQQKTAAVSNVKPPQEASASAIVNIMAMAAIGAIALIVSILGGLFALKVSRRTVRQSYN